MLTLKTKRAKHFKTHTMPNSKTKNLFNWGEISRLFSGTRSVIRKNSIPKVHEPIINEIVDAVDGILKREGIIK